MSSVWIAAIWAGAVVLISALILHRLGRPLAGVLDARRRRIEANIDNDRAASLERLDHAELDRATSAERAERQRAQLRRETAEADAAAEVASSTLLAQIAEQEQVIAARAEGRALAAKDKAARGDDGGSEDLRLLLASYADFRDATPRNYYTTLEDWLGDLRLREGQLTR